jgi:hypothetical protein
MMKKELCLMSVLLILCSAYSDINAAENGKAAPAAAAVPAQAP